MNGPAVPGAHYAARSTGWGAEGVKPSTSRFSIFFCGAFPFIQPSHQEQWHEGGRRNNWPRPGCKEARQVGGQVKTQNCTNLNLSFHPLPENEDFCLSWWGPLERSPMWKIHIIIIILIPLQRCRGEWEVGPPQANHSSKAHRTLVGREANQAKKTAESWQRKGIKDLPSLLSQIQLSSDKNPIPWEPPELHPPGTSTAQQCDQQGEQLPPPDRAWSALALLEGASNASHGLVATVLLC